MNRTGPDHERWADSTGAYALDALPEEERLAFEDHLGGCPACRVEADELRLAVAVLPASVSPAAPSPELKGRVMAEVQREAHLLAAAAAPADERVAPRAGRRAWSWPWRTTAGALAAVAAVAAVLVISLGRGGTTVVPASIDRAQVASGAHGELRVRDHAATLVISGLRDPEDGRVYQVWVKRPGRRPEPTNSLFTPRADGRASTGVPAPLDKGDAVLVTSEPRGGSEAPTRAPLLSAALS